MNLGGLGDIDRLAAVRTRRELPFGRGVLFPQLQAVQMHEVRFVAGWDEHLFVGQEVCEANGTVVVHVKVECLILCLHPAKALVVASLHMTGLPLKHLIKGGVTIVRVHCCLLAYVLVEGRHDCSFKALTTEDGTAHLILRNGVVVSAHGSDAWEADQDKR